MIHKKLIVAPTMLKALIAECIIQTGDERIIEEPKPPKVDPVYLKPRTFRAEDTKPAKTHPVRWTKPK